MSSKNQAIAKDFINKCKEYGFSYSVSDRVVSVDKIIAKNSSIEYDDADKKSTELLLMIPTTRAGSTWGSTRGTIGHLAALEKGDFTKHLSGCSKHVINAISKHI